MDRELWNYTFITTIARGWGLAIRCRQCDVERRWSDKVLTEKFTDRLDQPVSAVRSRLVCACGGRDLILYYYMSGAADTGAATRLGIQAREAELHKAAEVARRRL